MANGKTAIVFPGQGSQRQGMGKDFYESIPECRRIYEEASDALGWDVAALCFGEDEKLNLTAYAQPGIVVTEIAMLKAIMEKYGITPDVFGGHSLGEYTALVAAGVLPLETVIRIVHIRGRLMQEAVPVGQGSMAAVDPKGPQRPDDPGAALRSAHRRGEHQLAQPDRHQRPFEGHARGRKAPREGPGR